MGISNLKEVCYVALELHIFKKVILLVMSRAYETLGKTYSSEQEVMMAISDIAIQTYAAESLYLRVKKLVAMLGDEKGGMYKNILDVYFYEAAARINKSASDAINSASSEGRDSRDDVHKNSRPRNDHIRDFWPCRCNDHAGSASGGHPS